MCIRDSKVGGTIEEVFVQEGQDVAAGDPLFRLYSAEIAAEKNAAETELGEARAELAQKEIIHERELEAERLKVLEDVYKRQSSATPGAGAGPLTI